MNEMYLNCFEHGLVPVKIEYLPSNNGNKASCSICGRYIKFLGKEYFEPGDEMDEFIEVFEIDYYNALGLQKYNDVYGLIRLEKKAHDVYHKQWVFWSKWKDGKPVPVEKKRPMAIYLGNKESAIKMLESLLAKIKE